MKYIKIQSKKLFTHCVYSLSAIMVFALSLYYYFSYLNNTALSLSDATYYSTMFLTYALSWLIAPFLITRSIYFFIKMLRHGRKKGVSLFSIKFLFNPINLLILPGSLTPEGLTYRRRSLIAFFLFILMLLLMFSIAKYK